MFTLGTFLLVSCTKIFENFSESLGVESSKIDGISVNIDASIDKSIDNILAYYKTKEQVIARLKTLIIEGSNLNVPNSDYDNSPVSVTDIVVKKSNNIKYRLNNQWINYSLLIDMILDVPSSSNIPRFFSSDLVNGYRSTRVDVVRGRRRSVCRFWKINFPKPPTAGISAKTSG